MTGITSHQPSRRVERAFARTFHEEWVHVQTLTDQLETRFPAAKRTALNLGAGHGSQVSWAGFDAVDGMRQPPS